MKQKLLSMIALVAMIMLPQFAWADDVITYHLVTTDDGAAAGGAFEKSVDNTSDSENPKRWGLGSGKYIRCNPTAALQEGDKITIIAAPRSGSSAGLKLVSDASSTTEYTTIAGTANKQNKDLNLSYTVEANNGLIGKTEFYIVLADNNRNYWFRSVQITSATGTAVTFYNVAIDANITNGTVTASTSSTIAGAAVKLTATPATGYDFSAWDVKDGNSASVTVTNDKFIMPASNVTVGASFTLAPLYDITVATGIEHGSVAVKDNVAQAREGDEIELLITPDDGYYLQTLTLMQGETPLYVIDRKFTMPAGAVAIAATFAPTSSMGTMEEVFALTTTGAFGTDNGNYSFTKDGINYEKSGINNTWDSETENDAWRLNSTGAYLGCPLPIALKTGDQIIIVGRASSASTNFYLRTMTTSAPVAIIATGQTTEDTYTYTVEAGSALVGAEKFYLMISAASSTYLSAVTVKSTASVPRAVTFATMESGQVLADKETYMRGETVTLTVTPDEGYKLSTIIAQPYTEGDSDVPTPNFAPKRVPAVEDEIILTQDATDPNKYTFVMPNCNVKISASFEVDPTQQRYFTVSKEWSVFCSPLTIKVPEGVKAYTIKSVTAPSGTTSGTVVLQEQTIIAEGVPMVIENTVVSTTTKFKAIETTGSIAAEDQCSEFKGSAVATSTLSADNVNYVLREGAFIRTTATQVAKYSCYLELAAGTPLAAARSFNIVIEEETTGIKKVGTVTQEEGTWFNLNGVRIGQPTQKGVYILNGQKIVVK